MKKKKKVLGCWESGAFLWNFEEPNGLKWKWKIRWEEKKKKKKKRMNVHINIIDTNDEGLMLECWRRRRRRWRMPTGEMRTGGNLYYHIHWLRLLLLIVFFFFFSLFHCASVFRLSPYIRMRLRALSTSQLNSRLHRFFSFCLLFSIFYYISIKYWLEFMQEVYVFLATMWRV